ncbi:MAG: MiaB/RimO family radical SAM methylthiotransferase [Proteobacteria bacterium]|nr:MiaB/RimO family radical SAM methylthiotransferase [Pseudomonadota bacterium]
MVNLRIAIATVGCRSNQADSSALIRHLDSRVVEVVKEFDKADVVVVNTCCVTAEAERDCRKTARNALKASGSARVILSGCAVNAIKDFGQGIDERIELKSGIEAEPARLAGWINRLAGVAKGLAEGPPEDTSISSALFGRIRPFLKIQTGCSHYCTYCVVPKARGPESSMPRSAVLNEIAHFAQEGFNEVVLTGVQLGAWGMDLPGRPCLADLIVEVADRLGPGRLRLSSIEPWSVDKALIEVVGGHSRVCPHLHLPVQSGDDRILKAMGRGYTAREFIEVVRNIRMRIPGVALGTDVLLGFPGEDDLAFANTMQMLAEIDPAYVHAFSYSPRPGTRAADLPNRPERALAKERTRVVRDFGAKSARKYRAGQVGQVREVIVENLLEKSATGLTDTFVRVTLESNQFEPGDLASARLESAGSPEDRLKATVSQ